jgi:hypothetical protein
MPIRVKCPKCEKVLSALDSAGGKLATCPNCKGPIQIPAVAVDAPPPTLQVVNEKMSLREWWKPSFLWKRPLIAVPMLLILIPLAKGLGAWAGRSAARQEIAAEATAAGQPDGVLGTQWLMTKAQLRGVVPDAIPYKEDSLRNSADFMGRAATNIYQFENDSLLIVLVNFNGSSSEANYHATQEKLIAQYGPMPTPAADEDFKLSSRREENRFAVAHVLMDVNTSAGVVTKEQVIFYRTK